MPKCPWDHFQGTFSYKFSLCERPLCAWIVEPANTWSNLAFLIAGLFFVSRGTRDDSATDFYLGLAAFLMGICSFAVHATRIPLTGILDVTAILTFLCTLFVFNLLRAGIANRQRAGPLFAAILTFIIILQFTLPSLQIYLLATLILASVGFEFRLFRKAVVKPRLRTLWLALGFLSLAAASLGLDLTSSGCQPNNHIFQFHALWHLLSAIAVSCMVYYMKQFRIALRR